ncbi:MAG: hypothetical protein VB814_07300, partial [Pirellulaceae bacterium]
MPVITLLSSVSVACVRTRFSSSRGEGVPEIQGERITGLQSWQWAHEGTFDYPKENLLPRGP